MLGGVVLLKHYFIDVILNKVEYDPRTLILYVTEASGFTYKIGNVEDAEFYEFINHDAPRRYLEDFPF